MDFRKALRDLEQTPDDVADEYVASVVNQVSEWAAANGHAALVRDWTPAASRLQARRYLAEAIATTAIEPDGPLTANDVAEQLGVTSETVIEWIKAGQLKGANVGKGMQRGRYRILPSDLDAFLRSRQPERPDARSPRKASSVKNYRA
jgi:excisionase family DNA binding protein